MDLRRPTATVVGLVASAMLSFGQARVSEPPAEQSSMWEKTKQCADQAEKVMASKTRELPSEEFLRWNNHYSPKYDRCFIEIRHMLRIVSPNAKHDGVVFTGQTGLIGTELQDAFERKSMAWIDPEADGKSLNKRYCKLDDETADCGKTQNFVAEHMKN